MIRGFHLVLHCALLISQLCHGTEYTPLMAPLMGREQNSALFSFKSSWQVLGPFQIGTREAAWGADPLEYVGGFRNLLYDPNAIFRSSLPKNGIAKWNLTEPVQSSSTSSSANVSLSIGYYNVDWDFLKVVYGWAAVQYQAWARGEFVVDGNETQHVILHTDAVLEYWVDEKHYFGGDFYSFRKAPPVLHLQPGVHTIDLRLVRDVRAFGGILEPTIDVIVDVQRVSGRLELSKPGILISDVVEGKLAAPVGSVSLRNSGTEDIEVVDILPFNMTESNTGHYNSTSIVVVAGQTRPVAFNVSLRYHNSSAVMYNIIYKQIKSTQHSTLQVSQQLNHVSIYKPHKLTFLHPGGMASYAMLRPPAEKATCRSNQTMLPVLLALHGAGVEADNPMVTTAFDPVSDLCAWVLFPTGVTAWSGDDWHNWGFADVEAAVDAIPSWIETVGWQGSNVDTARWIVTGHSNGGQGTWYALTHRPDKILAAAPISGYASIQKYVPYELWQPADPRRTAIISASFNSYRHEMLMPNAHGIPIQQQHGELDDNVPAYNSRLLAQQVYLAGANSSYAEIARQNHWWETVMTTAELVAFYEKQTKNQDVLPRKLDEFSIIVGDPGDMGSKGGIKVTHLNDPGQYGRVQVKGRIITTSNVRSLELDPKIWSTTITLDGEVLDLTQTTPSFGAMISVYSSRNTWLIGTFKSETEAPQRQKGHLGGMTAILRTQGSFVIRHPGLQTTSLAVQVSRNLHQYFQADSMIISSASYAIPSNSTGNVITLALGSSLEGFQSTFSINVGSGGVSIRNFQGQLQHYGENIRGAAFLRPLEDGRLDLVLWGADEDGLRQAVRLVPMQTGVGQPDFILLAKSAQWKGIDGVLAMGFFDSYWKVTASSVVERG